MKSVSYSKAAIDFLKIALCIGVVVRHSSFYSFNIAEWLNVDISEINNCWFDGVMDIVRAITDICVPFFFLISGYLFFLNHKRNDISFYKGKIINRIKSLLVPYLIANVITFCASAILLNFKLPSLLSDITFITFAKSITVDPIVSPLWFIRNLFCVILLTPMIYWLLTHTKGLILLLFGFVWIVDMCQFDWYEGICPWFINYRFARTIFFFSVGSYIGLTNKELRNLHGGGYGCISIILSITSLWLRFKVVYFAPIFIMCAIPALFYLTSLLVKRYDISPKKDFVVATFFIYLYHGFLYVIIKRILIVVIKPTNDISMLAVYLLTLCSLLIILSFVYIIMRRVMPKTLSIVVGGR